MTIGIEEAGAVSSMVDDAIAQAKREYAARKPQPQPIQVSDAQAIAQMRDAALPAAARDSAQLQRVARENELKRQRAERERGY